MLSGPSRRSFVRGGLAFLGTCALPFPALSAHARTIPAKRFSDAIGICSHPNWRTPLWAETNWEDALAESGVMHIRGKIDRGLVGSSAMSKLRSFFEKEGQICVLIADQRPRLDRVGTKANIDFIANEVDPQRISAIESANEYNSPRSKPQDWASELRDFQEWLHATVRADRRLDNVPIVAPSVWGRVTNDYRRLGNLQPHVDKGCLHFYTAGLRPTLTRRRIDIAERSRTASLAQALEDARVVAPDKAQWMTEFGYPIAGPRLPLSPFFITETAAAKYLLRGLFDAFREGVERIYIYSLLDDVHRDPPRYHGLIDGRTLAKRQTFAAVKNLMELFADRGTGAVPNDLQYSLNVTADTLRHQLFEKSDGTFLLIMYQDVDSYDRVTLRNVQVAPVEVRLSLSRRCGIRVFSPTFSPTPAASLTATGTVTVSVADHVSVVSIEPQ